MLNLTDRKFLIEIVAHAIAQAHLTCASEELRNEWINAVAEAAAFVLEGDTFLFHWDSLENSLRFLSHDDGKVYEAADRHCQFCAARQSPQTPCFHRALNRLVGNYLEFQQRPGEADKTDFADAVFFDRKLSTRRKIELLNLSIAEGRTELKSLVEALQRCAVS